MLEAKEIKRNQKVLQVWQSRISCKELQVRIEDEEQRSIHKESNDEDNDKEDSFVRGSE